MSWLRVLGLTVVVALLLVATGAAQFTTRDLLLQNAVSANGNGTSANTTGYALIGVQVTTSGGPPTFTVNFEASVDSSTYVATACRPIAGGALVTTTTATGAWRCNVAGSKSFRARVSGYGGTGTITVVSSLVSGGLVDTGENVPDGSQTVNQGGVWTIQGAHVFQSGSWTVQAAHQGGQWNVDKVSHVTSAMTHVVGTVTIEGRGTAGTSAGGVVSVQGVASGTSLRVNLTTSPDVNQSGIWNIQAAHQGGQWNVAHVTSVLHVAGNITPRLACHSTAGITQTASSIVAHGSGSLIEICAVILVNSSTLGQNVSLVEGTGAACGTGTVGLIGGGAANVPLGANNGSITVVSGTPWLRTSVAGNNVCVLQSGTDRVAGTLTYRGVP